MKNALLVVFALLSLTTFGQKKVEEVVIHTSAECESCKERLEAKLNYTAGIKFADLDVPTKNLTVKFNTAKISLQEIKTIISDLGYNADDLPANPEAYEALPSCCKVNGMEHSEQK